MTLHHGIGRYRVKRGAYTPAFNPATAFADATVDMDFVNGVYNMAGTTALASIMTSARTGNAWADNKAGIWTMFGANALRITDKGLLSEANSTNIVLWSRDLTQATWVKTNITATKTATGISGVANSASQLTATAANGTVLGNTTVTSTARFQSAYVQRVTGIGNVDMTQDGGTTWTPITVLSANWTRVSIPQQTLVNPVVGFRMAVSGDVINVDFVQNELSNFWTSPIETAGAQVTRVTDIPTFTSSAWVSTTEGTVYHDFTIETHLAGNTTAFLLSDAGATNRIAVQTAGTTGLSTRYRFIVNDTSVGQALLDSSNWPYSLLGNPMKLGGAYKANDFSASWGGTTPLNDVAGTVPASITNARLSFSSQTQGAIYHRRWVYWPARKPNTFLQGISALGPPQEPETISLLQKMDIKPDTIRTIFIDTLIKTLKTYGLWAKLDVLYILAAHDAQAARLNWKNPALYAMVANNSPVFTIDRGFLGNSTSTSLVPTWNPTTFGGNFTLNDAVFGGWVQQVSTVNSSIDFYLVSTSRLGNNSTSTAYQGRLNDGSSISWPLAPGPGHWAIRRTGATSRTAWFNGVLQATDAIAVTTLPTNMVLLSTGAANFGNSRVAAAYAGGGFIDGEMALMHTALSTYMDQVSIEGETYQLLAAMTVQPNAARKTLIDNLIKVLKASGVWAKIDVLYVLAAHDKQAGQLNWKQPGTYTLTESGTPAWVMDRGYTGGGTGYVAHMPWNPSSTPGLNFQQNSAHLAAWSNTEAGPTIGHLIGTNSTGSIWLIPQADASGGTVRVNGNSLAFTSPSTANVYFVGNRTDSANVTLWRNGVATTGAVVSQSVMNTSVLCLNHFTGSNPYAGECSLFHFGSGLTDTEAEAARVGFAAYRTGVGL